MHMPCFSYKAASFPAWSTYLSSALVYDPASWEGFSACFLLLVAFWGPSYGLQLNQPALKSLDEASVGRRPWFFLMRDVDLQISYNSLFGLSNEVRQSKDRKQGIHQETWNSSNIQLLDHWHNLKRFVSWAPLV